MGSELTARPHCSRLLAATLSVCGVIPSLRLSVGSIFERQAQTEEGFSKRENLSSLKRFIASEVFRILLDDPAARLKRA